MLLRFLIGMILLTCPVYAQKRQVHHPNPLCDDYIRLKLKEYLDGYETVNYDDYMAYKKEITDYCSEMVGNNKVPAARRPSNALRSYDQSLD